jgi:hypothetical protein
MRAMFKCPLVKAGFEEESKEFLDVCGSLEDLKKNRSKTH